MRSELREVGERVLRAIVEERSSRPKLGEVHR